LEPRTPIRIRRDGEQSLMMIASKRVDLRRLLQRREQTVITHAATVLRGLAES
jgi:hypothetical protein